jgi:hypothetical protein
MALRRGEHDGVWEDDRAEVVTREFASMVSLIESGEYSTEAAVARYLRDKRERWIERYPAGWTETAGWSGAMTSQG